MKIPLVSQETYLWGEDKNWSFQTQLDKADTLEFDVHGGAQRKEEKMSRCRQLLTAA